ncbi:FAD-dependent oxidoreductase [Nocardia nova]|uniref:FAD-dependent oxidoreductase n=1 Tax=Nocardia nova TaxID=37330 RepID=UPI0033DA1C8F
MKAEPRFYFSLRSPYSWLALEDMLSRRDNLAHSLTWIPFWDPDAAMLAALEQAGGGFCYASMSREKHLYILQDVRRATTARGLPMTWPVDRNPWWEVPHLACLAAAESGRMPELAVALTRARWREGRDICDPDLVTALARDAGLDGERIAASVTDPRLREAGVRALLRAYRDGVSGCRSSCGELPNSGVWNVWMPSPSPRRTPPAHRWTSRRPCRLAAIWDMPVAAVEAAWDAIVVGAGIGGLVCAGYLAQAGRRVLVVEQHDVAGGNAHVFRRRRSYEFDVGVHYLGDCGPGGIIPAILNGLGVADRVRLRPMNSSGFDRIELPGRTIDVPVGWGAYRDRLGAELPAERTATAACASIFEALGAMMRAALIAPEEVAELARRHPGALSWSRRPLAALFDEYRLSPSARTVLAAQSGNYGAAPSGVTVATHAAVMDHYLRGAYYLDGGGQTLVAALVETIEAHGGQVRTRAAVRTVHTEGGVASGVSFDDDERESAPVVISNADFRRTVLELCSDTTGFSGAGAAAHAGSANAARMGGSVSGIDRGATRTRRRQSVVFRPRGPRRGVPAIRRRKRPGSVHLRVLCLRPSGAATVGMPAGPRHRPGHVTVRYADPLVGQRYPISSRSSLPSVETAADR